MFASNLFRDEAELRQFCDDVQQDLRDGSVTAAAERVAFALGVLEEYGHPIVSLCRAYPADRIHVHGWEDIAGRLNALDRPNQPVTAISIDLSSHGEFSEDNDDAIAPYLETSFFSDGAFPFSTSDRAALCAGYNGSSSEWQGNFEDIDGTIAISGIGQLSFAIDELERQHRIHNSGDAVGSDAAVVALAYRAVAVHQAINAMVDNYGLPRPLTIIVGSNESYPFFNAPIILFTECLALDPDASEFPAEDIEFEMPVELEPSMPLMPSMTVEPSMALESPMPLEPSMPLELSMPPESPMPLEPLMPPEPPMLVMPSMPFEPSTPLEPSITLEPSVQLELSEPPEPSMPLMPSMPLEPTYQIRQPTPEVHISGTEIRRRFAEAPVDTEEKVPSSLFDRLFSRSSGREAR